MTKRHIEQVFQSPMTSPAGGPRPKQIATKVEVIDGQKVRVRVMEPRYAFDVSMVPEVHWEARKNAR